MLHSGIISSIYENSSRIVEREIEMNNIIAIISLHQFEPIHSRIFLPSPSQTKDVFPFATTRARTGFAARPRLPWRDDARTPKDEVLRVLSRHITEIRRSTSPMAERRSSKTSGDAGKHCTQFLDAENTFPRFTRQRGHTSSRSVRRPPSHRGAPLSHSFST